MFQNLKKKHWVLFFILIPVVGAYIVGLFIDLTRDGAKYAYISKEIAEGGSWLNLQIQGQLYTQKPQFLFWLSAASFVLLGISNFAFKLPILLYSILGLYAVYRLGKALYDKKTGQIAALMLLFSVISVLYNMDIHTDIVLQTNVALALWMLYEYLLQPKIKWLVGAGIGLGLALLTKGPFGLMVPVLSVLGYLLSTRQAKRIFDLRWLLLVAVALTVSLPAWIFYYKQWGWEGIRFFVWTNTVGRANGDYFGSTTDPTFYIHNLLYLFIPWSLFFYYSSIQIFKKQFRQKLLPSDQYVFWGIWLPFLLLTLSSSKLPNYIQCIIPFIAVQTARSWIINFQNKEMNKKVVAIQNTMIVFLWILVPLASFVLFPVKSPVWIIVLMLFLITVHFVTKQWDTESRMFYRSIAASGALLLLMILHVSPILFGTQAQLSAANTINSKAKLHDLAFNFNYKSILEKANKAKNHRQNEQKATFNDENYNYELMFNSKLRIEQVKNANQILFVIPNRNVWVYADEEGHHFLSKQAILPDTTYVIPHFNLARTIKYINPKTRNKAMETKYLLYYNNDKKE